MDIERLCYWGRAMTGMPDSEKFHVRKGANAGILPDDAWSAQPEITMFRTDDLLVRAFRYRQSPVHGIAEVIADEPELQDCDALTVRSNPDGMLSIEIKRYHQQSTTRRDVCCFIPMGANSMFESGNEGGSFTLYFQAGFLRGMLEGDAEDDPDSTGGRYLPQVAQLMFLVESELRRPSLGSHLMIEGLLRALAALLPLNGDVTPRREPCARIYLSPHKLKRVIEFIEANLQESIGLEDLAAAAGLSANHFLRVFKLATGMTPYHFLRTRRLEMARLLLTSDDMPLAQLALECGFANQSHFTAAFSRELGVSPGRYRRSMRS